MRGYTDDKDAVLKRLRRNRGLGWRLAANGRRRYLLLHVLTKVSAVAKALQAVAPELVDGHESDGLAVRGR